MLILNRIKTQSYFKKFQTIMQKQLEQTERELKIKIHKELSLWIDEI